MDKVRIAAALAVALAAAAPGLTAEKPKKAYDPDREICKSKPAIGSRLQRIRECHTAQQWLEMKQQEQWGLRRQQINGAPGPKG
ncbi:MAG TPA: hypothetical protein VF605_08875 [Allosphingosinicella sp.]|jgi:hypothetical protein